MSTYVRLGHLAISCSLTLVFTLGIIEVVLERHAELATSIRFKIRYVNTAIHTYLGCIHFKQVAGKELDTETVLEESSECSVERQESFPDVSEQFVCCLFREDADLVSRLQ